VNKEEKFYFLKDHKSRWGKCLVGWKR
jgi:hypothetical protein